MNNMKLRLIVMNFLEYAVWGAYLTSMGAFLATHGMGDYIGWFYAIQGIVSLFMPALVGIVADRWIPAQKLLSLCHALAGVFMLAAGTYGIVAGETISLVLLMSLYTCSVAFFMPTIALSNSVAYTCIGLAKLDTVKDFPPIRVFGTVGFICTMWVVDLAGFQMTAWQFIVSGGLGVLLALYSLTLPNCPLRGKVEGQTWAQAMGLDAFKLFKQKKMAIFFIFSMLLGVSLQITNGFANPFLTSFQAIPVFANTFGAQHANMLISISQICEALCILFIPFCLRKWGIKNVMLFAMFAWVLRFGLFGLGDPGTGVWMFILSCIVYGFAFDFFNISGSLYVDQETKPEMRSSAQGLFMMMTNGFGASIGTLSAQAIVKHFTHEVALDGNKYMIGNELCLHLSEKCQIALNGWQASWYIFAAYALVVAILFWIFFQYKHKPKPEEKA